MIHPGCGAPFRDPGSKRRRLAGTSSWVVISPKLKEQGVRKIHSDESREVVCASVIVQVISIHREIHPRAVSLSSPLELLRNSIDAL